MLAVAYRWRQRGDGGGPVVGYAGTMGCSQLGVYVAWLALHGGAMPTFDDLAHGPAELPVGCFKPVVRAGDFIVMPEATLHGVVPCVPRLAPFMA